MPREVPHNLRSDPPESRREPGEPARDPAEQGSEAAASSTSPDARSLEDLLEPDDRPGGIPELFRRAMAIGLSGLFSTESAIRGALGDTLPKDWVDFAADQSERTRSEFASRVAVEMARVLEQTDLVEFAERLLEGRSVEITAQIRLGPRDGDPRGEPGDGTESPAHGSALDIRLSGGEKTRPSED